MEDINRKQSNDFVYSPSESSRHSTNDTKAISSPEMLSSATSLSTPSSSSSDEDEELTKTVTTTTPDEKKSMIDDSTRLEPGEITAEQA